MILNKDRVIELCFAFYNQGVSDGDYGVIHRFADMYKNRSCNDFNIFKEYVERKRIFNMTPSRIQKVNSDICSDKLWGNVWNEDRTLDSIVGRND